jgi:hypothetical protein
MAFSVTTEHDEVMGLSGIVPYPGLGERRDMYLERRDLGRELRLDEDHQDVGQHAFICHCLSALRVDERPDVCDAEGPKNSSRFGEASQ